MKNKSFLNILGAFFAVLFLFTACEKEDPVTLEAQNETWGILNITSTSATLTGIVVAEGDGNKEYGVCLSKTTEPTVDDMKVVATEIDNAVYKVEATGLEYLTKYYVRAYVINNAGTVSYGEEVYFTTLANAPAVTVADITAITGKSATSGGNVTDDGKADVTAKGIVYATTENPMLDGEGVTLIEAGEGTGEFTSTMSGLNGGTTYYVRAFAVNSAGTTYTAQKEFTTLVSTATITTNSADNVTKTTFDVAGTLIATGGADITEKGFVYGTSADPTVEADTKVVDATTDLGDFTAIIDGLDLDTEYHVRAYATNSEGTEYGANMTIRTLPDVLKLRIVGDAQVVSGYSDADWAPDKATYIMNTKTDAIVEGFIYFGKDNASFKFCDISNLSDPTNVWSGTNYGAGANPGELSTDAGAGNLPIAEKGLYKLTVDIANLTYTATKMDFRLIGGAVGGWNNENEIDMVYNKSLHRLVATANFTADIFKFRANHEWNLPAGYNFGDNDADGTVEYGGADITATAGIQTAILNLTTAVADDDEFLRLDYTQAVTTWGIIGDAAGGWGDGQDLLMTGNVANNTWTYTGSLAAGAWKFRANGGWDINLGGTTDNLSFGGDNMNIETAGDYTVVLDLTTGTCTVTPVPNK